MSNCNLTMCRCNENGKCTNEEKSAVEVAEKVLCLKECINNLCTCNTNSRCYAKEQEKQCPKRITKKNANKLRYWE